MFYNRYCVIKHEIQVLVKELGGRKRARLRLQYQDRRGKKKKEEESERTKKEEDSMILWSKPHPHPMSFFFSLSHKSHYKTVSLVHVVVRNAHKHVAFFFFICLFEACWVNTGAAGIKTSPSSLFDCLRGKANSDGLFLTRKKCFRFFKVQPLYFFPAFFFSDSTYAALFTTLLTIPPSRCLHGSWYWSLHYCCVHFAKQSKKSHEEEKLIAQKTKLFFVSFISRSTSQLYSTLFSFLSFLLVLFSRYLPFS